MNVVPIDKMPRFPWEPAKGSWMTIHTFDRWIKPYEQTWFWMRKHRARSEPVPWKPVYP